MLVQMKQSVAQIFIVKQEFYIRDGQRSAKLMITPDVMFIGL
jgi:hypothetical protein